MSLAADVKARVSLVEVAGRALTWDLRKSIPAKGDWWAPCPFHGEATASFHVTETGGAGGQFYCFGCHAKGSVVDFVMADRGLSFGDAVKALAREGGVDTVADPARQAEVEAAAKKRRDDAARAAQRIAAHNLTRARDLWGRCTPDHPALAEYLEGRGIRLGVLGGVPATLRFHPELPATDRSGQVVHTGPAMVAAIGRKGRFVGVHRTWIDGPARARLPDGAKVPKQMLGETGAIFGQPVMLAPRAALVLVGEGIETTLAALAAFRHRRPGVPVTAEAALTLGALAGAADPAAPAPALIGANGRPVPSEIPDPARPGWVPAAHHRAAVVLADPSTKCPASAEANANRALAKLRVLCPDGAALRVPLGRFDHPDDFADLALKGTLYAE